MTRSRCTILCSLLSLICLSCFEQAQRITGTYARAGGPVATSIRIDVPSSITQNDHNARAVVTVTAANGSIPSGQVTMSYSGFQGGAAFAHTLVNGSTAYTLDSLPVG